MELFDKRLKKFLQYSYIYIYQHPYNIGFTSLYIIKFIKNLKISCLDIILLDDKYLVDFYKNINLKIILDKFLLLKLKKYLIII